MHRKLLTTAALAAALGGVAGGVCTPAAAAPLPVGTVITALQDGNADMLGLDSGFTPGPGSNITALTDDDLEFLSADYGIGIDFFSSGTVHLYDNSGSGIAATTLLFHFGALGWPVGSVSVDTSALLGGSVLATLVDGNTLQLTLRDVQLDGTFGPLAIQLQSIPEPTPLALLAAAALAAALRRRPGPARD